MRLLSSFLERGYVVYIWCKIITKLYNISKETPYTTPTQNSNTLQKRIIRALSRRKLAVKKKGKITLKREIRSRDRGL